MQSTVKYTNREKNINLYLTVSNYHVKMFWRHLIQVGPKHWYLRDTQLFYFGGLKRDSIFKEIIHVNDKVFRRRTRLIQGSGTWDSPEAWMSCVRQHRGDLTGHPKIMLGKMLNLWHEDTRLPVSECVSVCDTGLMSELFSESEWEYVCVHLIHR